MKFMDKKNSQKGGTKVGYVLLGIVLTIVVIFLIGYFQDRDHFGSHDWRIHIPHIEVH